MNEVERLIKKYIVKPNNYKNFVPAEPYRKAGFMQLAKQLEQQKKLEKLSMHHVVLKKPGFRLVPEMELKLGINPAILAKTACVSLLMLLGAMIILFFSWGRDAFFEPVPMSIFGTLLLSALMAGIVGSWEGRRRYSAVRIGWNKYLVESRLENYGGYVPATIAEVALQYKQKYDLRVWSIVPRSKVSLMTEPAEMIRVDPLLIGYVQELPNYVVVLAVWGNDVEDLDRYFQKRKDSSLAKFC